jgi:DNA topoisomerase-1
MANGERTERTVGSRTKSNGGTANAARVTDTRKALVFGLDDEPGIRRRGRRHFRYVDETTDTPIDDEETLARIRALAVPPAWTDVWIAADPCRHVQATGRDARGRKQYRYHAEFRQQQEESKFDLLLPFGEALPALRRRVDRDLRRRGLPQERVIAVVVRLLEDTLVRVGNEEYARTNGSFGLTTLRDRHVRVSGSGSGVRLRFVGKAGKAHDVAIEDARLARLVRKCQDVPGQVLFQYIDSDERNRPIKSTDVNDYLRDVTGIDATAKMFRTWTATLMAATGFGSLPPPASRREANQTVRALVGLVSHQLNNTPAVCRRSYIHPVVIDRYIDGSFPEVWRSASARGSAVLEPDERRLLSVLRALPSACATAA